MDTPFYRIRHPSYQYTPCYTYPYASSSSSSSSPSSIPVNRPTTPARKVVSIPVHYVGSERRRSDSAVKIQKVFRGLLVRKSMKKISAISREVNEMEKKISSEETVELIRKDAKERLKVNELLMRLLIQLDSVHGVDSGVRNCRKAVTKKAIALQEMVDAIVAVDSKPDNGDSGSDSDSDSGLPAVEDTNSISDINEEVKLKSEADVAPEVEDNMELTGVVEESVSECAESVGTSQFESQIDSSANPQCLIEGYEEDVNGGDDDDDDDDDALGKHENEEENHQPGEKEENAGSGGGMEEKEKSRELLEKMVAENEKMMGLLIELFEKNERQTRLLNVLSQRVKHLEMAFLCDKLRRKKKRNAAGLMDCLESTLDNRKCGKNL